MHHVNTIQLPPASLMQTPPKGTRRRVLSATSDENYETAKAECMARLKETFPPYRKNVSSVVYLNYSRRSVDRETTMLFYAVLTCGVPVAVSACAAIVAADTTPRGPDVLFAVAAVVLSAAAVAYVARYGRHHKRKAMGEWLMLAVNGSDPQCDAMREFFGAVFISNQEEVGVHISVRGIEKVLRMRAEAATQGAGEQEEEI